MTIPARARGAGVELAYEETGSGPPVLLVHGTALTRLSWRATAEALGGAVRSIAYDRRGYGDSEAPEPYAGTTIEEQSEDAARLLRALDAAPAVVCGHSAGGIVALDLLLRHPGLVSAVAVIEPPLLWLSPAGEPMLAEVRQAVEQAAREGGATTAAQTFVERQEGPGLPGSAGAFADFGAVAAWEFSRRRVASVSVPVLVLRGARSSAAYRDAAAALADAIGGARLRELDASHMGPLEDPAGVAAAIRELTAR